MTKINLTCIGRLKPGPLKDAAEEYRKRIRWPLEIREIVVSDSNPELKNQTENDKIISHLERDSFVVALDSRGRTLTSEDFADRFETLPHTGFSQIQFIIGGADGLNDACRKKADLLLGFGQMTWPHLLARVMLLEQIYRAQQILAGHSYHRA